MATLNEIFTPSHEVVQGVAMVSEELLPHARGVLRRQ